MKQDDADEQNGTIFVFQPIKVKRNSQTSLVLCGSLRRFCVFLVTLDNDQVIVPIGCYHHVILLACNSKEREIVLGIEVADQAASRYRELG